MVYCAPGMPAEAVKCRSMLRRPASAFYRSCSRQSMGVRARGWGYTRVTWENVYTDRQQETWSAIPSTPWERVWASSLESLGCPELALRNCHCCYRRSGPETDKNIISTDDHVPNRKLTGAEGCRLPSREVDSAAPPELPEQFAFIQLITRT